MSETYNQTLLWKVLNVQNLKTRSQTLLKNTPTRSQSEPTQNFSARNPKIWGFPPTPLHTRSSNFQIKNPFLKHPPLFSIFLFFFFALPRRTELQYGHLRKVGRFVSIFRNLQQCRRSARLLQCRRVARRSQRRLLLLLLLLHRWKLLPLRRGWRGKRSWETKRLKIAWELRIGQTSRMVARMNLRIGLLENRCLLTMPGDDGLNDIRRRWNCFVLFWFFCLPIWNFLNSILFYLFLYFFGIWLSVAFLFFNVQR